MARGTRPKGTGRRAQGTGHRAQSTGHRAQGTERRAQGKNGKRRRGEDEGENGGMGEWETKKPQDNV